MPRVYVSDKRRVNTCTECRRRKQRCNRQLPCHFCSLRGTPAKCVFLRNEGPSTTLASDPATCPLKEAENDSTLRESVADARFSDDQGSTILPSQIGYQTSRNHDNLPDVLNVLQAYATPAHKPHASDVLYPHRIGKDRWSKCCQMFQNLPEQTIIQGLIDVFFNEANWYLTVLDRYSFDNAYRDWLVYGPKTDSNVSKGFVSDHIFLPALLLQILAVAIQFVPETSAIASTMRSRNLIPNDKLSQKYSDDGDSILDLLGRHYHSLIAVQADLIRCAWLKNSGQGSRAWYSLGNAIRQAQDIGLHLQPETSSLENTMDSLSEAWRNESKKRLWACLFTWESHMALQLGRPCTIHASDCTIGMLIDADIPQDPSRTLFQPQTADEGPPKSTSQIVKYVLAQKIQDLMSARAFAPDFSNYPLIRAIHKEVNSFLRTLSPCLQADLPDTSWDVVRPDTILHRLQIAIIVNSFLLSLHRPYVKRHTESFNAAIDAAIKVLDYSQILFERLSKHQHKTFTLIFYTIDAGILLAVISATLQQTDMRYKHAIQSLHHAVSRLTILGQRNSAAVAGARALSKCIQKLALKHEEGGDDSINVHTQLVQAAFPEQYHNPTEPVIDGHMGESPTSALLDHPNMQDQPPIDDWDFLPTFDSPDDILTAMTIDSGYTSVWLEQSLDALDSWE